MIPAIASSEKPLAIIVAMTKNLLIGKENNLPWHIPEDLKMFKQTTMGNILIMGRKTFESIGKPLPGRKNFVVSASAFKEKTAADFPCHSVEKQNPYNTKEYEAGKVYYFKSLENAINASFLTEGNPFIIGGASIYEQALPLVKTLYISFVKKNYTGDVYFPELNLVEWDIIEEKDFQDFTWGSYRRKSVSI